MEKEEAFNRVSDLANGIKNAAEIQSQIIQELVEDLKKLQKLYEQN